MIRVLLKTFDIKVLAHKMHLSVDVKRNFFSLVEIHMYLSFKFMLSRYARKSYENKESSKENFKILYSIKKKPEYKPRKQSCDGVFQINNYPPTSAQRCSDVTC